MTHLKRHILGLMAIGCFAPTTLAFASVLTLDANGNYVDAKPVQSGGTPYALPVKAVLPALAEEGVPFPDPNGAVATDPKQMESPYSNYEIILDDVARLAEEPSENVIMNTEASGVTRSEYLASEIITASNTVADEMVFEVIAPAKASIARDVIVHDNEQTPLELAVLPSMPVQTGVAMASVFISKEQSRTEPLVLKTMPSMEMTPLAEAAKPLQASRNEFDDIIDAEIAKYNNVDMAFVKAVISTESNYNPTAVSPKGAMGLMQIMPSTAKTYGVVNPFSPEQNIRAGVAELSRLMTVYKNPTLALAGYNAGQAAVDEHDGVPPYSETQQYIVRVLTKTFETRESLLAQAAKNVESSKEKLVAEKENNQVSRPLTVQSYDW